MSVAEVQSRISEIQAQLASLAPQTTAATSGAAFAGALRRTSAASGAGGSSSGSPVGGDQVVAEARKYIGVPYVWGGTDPKRGLDCSGLVQLVYKNLGYNLPRVACDQAQCGTAVTGGLANARPGDLLTFGSPAHHIAIYVGGGKMIEAPRPGLDVREVDVYETPTSIRRILPSGDTTGATSGSLTGTPYADLFTAASQKYGVDAKLLAAVARQESGFNPTAVSGVGAQGLMQLMPGTARSLGVTNPFDPAQSIDGAARLLKGLEQEFGRTDLALAAYNAGPGAVHRYGGIPPYPETQNYVRNIMAMLGGS